MQMCYVLCHCEKVVNSECLVASMREFAECQSVDIIFVISRLITKFTKILCHENLELYGNVVAA